VTRRTRDFATSSCDDPGSSCECAPSEFERTLTYCYQPRSPECYLETLCCSSFESQDAACTLSSSEGDAEIKAEPSVPFAAAVEDYVVIYTDTDAPAGSEFAEYLFGSGATGVPKGYHLLHTVAKDPESQDLQPEYDSTIVSTDQAIALTFKRGAIPLGLNL
jgi:hypothetical protein